eukprot:m.145967 g.145967  ORF g.145967 m.145967 type:complete len:73 (+) comp16796_c1_seq1:330-548(+)
MSRKLLLQLLRLRLLASQQLARCFEAVTFELFLSLQARRWRASMMVLQVVLLLLRSVPLRGFLTAFFPFLPL